MMKAKNIVLGKEIEIIIIDSNYSDDCVEVKIMEGCFAGKCVIVKKEDLVKGEKVKASLKVSKFENDTDNEDEKRRALCVTVTSVDDNTLYNIIGEFERRLNKKGLDIEFCYCPFEDGDMVGDTCYINFKYGEMKETKEIIKGTWKELKRDMNIR